MKRKIYFLPLLLLTFAFFACEETSEPTEYDNWKERNELFMDSLQTAYDAGNSGLGVLTDLKDTSQKIFYKILKEGDTSKQRPFSTSAVDCYYRGMLINEAVFNASTNKNYTQLYENLNVFDSNFSGPDPDPLFDSTTHFEVGGVVPGWTTALQWMYPGARWELYIPYGSGYSSGGSGTRVPGYSTLIFDVTLVDVEY